VCVCVNALGSDPFTP